jgi:FAD/FMN-containing dehydrogenase/Fe-S oxidoreductase
MQKSSPDHGISNELKAALDQEYIIHKSDQVTRLLYSTDASIYQVMPLGVVWPQDAVDVSSIIEIAGDHGVPVLPRGGGSSLAGQAIGEALILDFSRYMDRVIDLNVEEKSVIVQPGVVLGSLNRQLAKYNLTFGPDPASADRATIGGVLGNNASGAHSILYGMAHDHLLSAETILSDGSAVNFSDQKNVSSTSKNSFESAIYKHLPEILARYQDPIQKNYPRTFRNVAGYNLNILAAQETLNPAVLLAGSEGTLGIITSAKLNLVPLPASTTLYLVHFQDLGEALSSVPEILKTNPSAVELIDSMLIRLARANPAYQPLLKSIQGDPEAILAVEYQADDPDPISNMDQTLKRFGPTVPLLEVKEQARIWKARKVGLGILQSQRGDAKSTTFIEDAAVPVEHLADYTLGIRDYAAEIGVGGIAFYAHASAGLLHIRPQVNLKSEDGLRQMRQLAERSLALVKEYGGTITGEHGEGFVRGEFTRELYGPELMEAFKEVKELFDPSYIFNPGKIINPPRMDDTSILRYGINYQADQKPVATLQSFDSDLGFDRAVEMCNGAGVCRQLEDGVMCPSFQGSRDEENSTRGRANMLRAAISGKLGPRGMTSRELYQVLDLCLSCQACSSECPSSVDMSKLKAEFLHGYYQEHGLSFRSWFFANVAEISNFASRFAPIANLMLRSPIAQGFSLIGIHPDRKLPDFSNQTFTRWHRKLARSQEPPSGPQAVFFYDTYLEYNYPHIGKALTKICQLAGIELIILDGQGDSGRPAYSKGVLRKAQKLAKKNIGLLTPYAEQGIPIIGCEPSDIVMLKKEYRDLVPGPAAERIAELAVLAEDYLLQFDHHGWNFDHTPRKILYHGHCQQKANLGTERTLDLLRSIPGSQVQEIDAGCCGMAGAFGYEKEHYQLSTDIAELRLAPQIRSSDAGTIICASGTSCREQILHTTNRDAKHPLEVFADALI